MTVLRLLFSCAAAVCLGGATLPESEIRYTVTPVLADGAASGLRIDIAFQGDADGETLVHLPDEWAGTQDLWRNLTDLQTHGATTEADGRLTARILRHRANAPIRLSYVVTSPYRTDPGREYRKGNPIIRSDWFFFHGEGVFAIPDNRRDAPATFRWGELPADWKAASDLDHLANRSGTLADISESVGIGGTRLDVVAAEVDGAPLRLAMLGDWDFEPVALADAIRRILVAENAYWQAPARPYFIAMAPLGTVEGLSYTGTGRGDAFSIASTTGFPLDDATQFLAHELNHNWMPAALGGMPRQNEGTDYWLSEGFNDYLTARILLRAGLWDIGRFVTYKNEVLLRYASSPARTASANEVAAQFWTNRDMHQISYDRGHLLAMLLDGRVREASGSRRNLDDVLLAQQEAWKTRGEPILATALFTETLRGAGGIDAAADIARYTATGDPILLPANLFGDCARIATANRKTFHRGYDADATAEAGGIIAGVRPDGPAYAAGMRDGMRLIKREFGTLGDSTVEIGYRVETGGTERVIRYFPAGDEDLTVQKLELAQGGDQPKTQCLRLFAGR